MQAPLIGREEELERLGAALGDAEGGRGRVVMLAGEAGIGKTALARAFAELAVERGAAVLRGDALEGDWQPPFGPWAEAIGGYARTTDPTELEAQLGPGAPVIADLVLDVRTALPHMPRPPRLPPDQERFRLYEGIARFLAAATEARPVVLALDDLHWADLDSLQLLRYVCRTSRDARVLVVGTYRRSEVDAEPGHPLADLLAMVGRETGYERIPLGGFDRGQVDEYLRALAREQLPAEVVDALHRETDGNPFFLRELFLHLMEEERIQPRDGAWATAGGLTVPESVRHVLSRRLSRLSAHASEMLRLASALTGGFDFRILQALTRLSPEELLDAIDEALAAGLLRAAEDEATYDFAHALVRHALMSELNPDRQARLHRRVAEAFEESYRGSELEHAAELAAQYRASAPLPGAERGVAYALAAAEQADASHAYDRAVTFLRMARDLADEQPASTRWDVLCRLALAEATALMLSEAERTAHLALAAAAEARIWPAGVVEFLIAVVRGLREGGGSQRSWEPFLDRGLELTGDHRDLAWARLQLLREPVRVVLRGEVNAGVWTGHDPDAVRLARGSGSETDYALTLHPYDWRSREEAEELLRLARAWGEPSAALRAYDAAARALMHCHGDVHAGAVVVEEILATSQRVGSVAGHAEALVQVALVAMVKGELDRAEEALGQAADLAARLGSVHRLRYLAETVVRSMLEWFRGEGDWERHATELARFASGAEPAAGPLGFFSAAAAAMFFAMSDDETRARRLLELLTPALLELPPRTYQHHKAVDWAAGAVWELGAEEYASDYRRLSETLARAEIGDSVVGSHPLTTARMAALAGDPSAARESFERARSHLEATGWWPFRAIVDLDEALALRRSGDNGGSSVLLEAAVEGFRRLGMTGWERRALDLLGVRAQPEHPAGLTPREAEVLRLIAAARTNKEIARDLFISVATVERHVANVYRKIGARNRADATAFALTSGVVPTDA